MADLEFRRDLYRGTARDYDRFRVHQFPTGHAWATETLTGLGLPETIGFAYELARRPHR